MNSSVFADWLAALSETDRIRILARLASALTVQTRQLFLPDVPKGNGQMIIKMLQGVNELHHTISNKLVAAHYGDKGMPLTGFSEQLAEIATHYQIEPLLMSAINFIQGKYTVQY